MLYMDKFVRLRDAIWNTITEAGVISADYRPIVSWTFADDIALIVFDIHPCLLLFPGDVKGLGVVTDCSINIDFTRL